MIDEVTLAKFRARLAEELEALSGEGELGAEDRATVTLDQQAVGRLTRVEAMQRQAMAEARDRRRKMREARIRAALQRIEDKEFGWCAECGDEIAQRRLEIDATLGTCVGCARA